MTPLPDCYELATDPQKWIRKRLKTYPLSTNTNDNCNQSSPTVGPSLKKVEVGRLLGCLHLDTEVLLNLLDFVFDKKRG